MKTTILKFFTLSAAIFAFSTISFGQDTDNATASAGANIIRPLTITKESDLHFGDLVPSTEGSVIVKMEQDGTISSAAQYYLSTVTRTAASFTITGQPLHSYNINADATVTLAGQDAAAGSTMVLTFDPSLDIDGTSLTMPETGTQNLSLGGSLALAKNQQAGTYTVDFNVTVAYE